MINKIIIQGRLTADPELRKTMNEISVCNFSIANETFSSDGEKKVDFYKVVAWKHTAEIVFKNFSKGRPILIDGHLSVNEYSDKNGNSRRSVEIIAERIYFIGDVSSAAKEKSFDENAENFDLPNI